MPQNKYALARYRLIDGCFQKQIYVKTSYLVQLCEKTFGYSISQRMIQLDMEAMKHDSFLGFYAPIEYCPKRKAYYYTYGYTISSTINFSPEEIQLLIYLITYLDNRIKKDYYKLFVELVQKIRNNSLY